MRSFRRSIRIIILTATAPLALAQYTISTIVGGGSPPNGALSTGVSLPSTTSGIAVDAGGNIYLVASQQNRVYRAATDGTLTTVAGTGVAGFSGDGVSAVSSQLSSPNSIALDRAGNLYITDAANCRIRKVSGGIISTVAGSGLCGFSGDGGSATAAQLSYPNAIAVDKDGNIFFSDNNRIRKVAAGIITTIAGNGNSGFTGDNGPATAATLSYINGIAVDNSGNLFISDAGNVRVRKVAGGIISTVAGNGTYGFSGDGGSAISAQLVSPQGLGTDLNGNLYIGDNNRIRKVSGRIISTVAGGGSGCAQQTDAVGDGCPALNVSLTAGAIALDASNNLYVVDFSSFRLRKIAAGVVSTVVGNGFYQYSGDGGLSGKAQISPQSVAVLSPGNLYIADNQGYRVRNSSGGLITTVVGTGVCCYNGENIAAIASQVNPSGVAVDYAGSVYTAEGNRVRKTSGGIITTIAGNGGYGYSGDNGPATSATFSNAQKAAVDSSGTVYIADRGNNRIRKVSGGVITTIAGGGPATGVAATSISANLPSAVAVDAAGNVYYPAPNDHRVYKVSTAGTISVVAGNGSAGFSGDNGPATSAQLNYPSGIAVNSAGTAIYIADRSNNRVRLVSGGLISTVAGGGTGCAQQTDAVGDNCSSGSALLNFPSQLALNSAGTVLYIADALNYRIRKVTGGLITTVAGNGVLGSLGDNGPAVAANLNYAAAIAIDNNTGDLYIGDSENYRVRKVSGGTITNVAGTGAYGFAGDDGPATSAQLSTCYGVSVDSAGALYIADAANARIRKVVNGVITTVVGTGTRGYSGDNMAAISAQINTPYDVAVDGSGNLYVADTANYRIRKISSGTISTIAGNGAASFSGDGGPAAQAQLDSPSDVAVDAAGNVYVSDSNNRRIRKISAGGTITTVAGNGACCFAGDNGPATDASISPSGIAVDAASNLYLSESTNRVRKVSAGTITTIAGTGQAGSSGDGGPATNALFNFPQGVAVDSSGNIYVADTNNFSIRLLTMNPKVISSITPASALVGSSSFTIQVLGSGFLNSDIVQWNGANLTTTYVNSGQISALVNSGQLAQAGPAAVTVNGVSNAAAFTVLTSLTPALQVSKTHFDTFSQGQAGATYSVTVSNTAGVGATSGTVTLTESVPSGLTLVSMSGSGWTCPSGGVSCTRSDSLSGGSSYPPITVTVNVTANAPTQLTNHVSVAGGGSATAQSNDVTTVNIVVRSVGAASTGVYQPMYNAWALDSNLDGGFNAGDRYFYFLSSPGDIAVTGDWTGDGKTKIGIYRNGSWYLDVNNNGIWDGPGIDSLVMFGGQVGDVPVVGDWNGDGRTKVGVNRRGFWILDTNGSGAYDSGDQFFAFGGNAGEQLVLGDWNGDGRTKVGFFNNGTWLLDYNGNGALDSGDKSYSFTTYAAGDKAVVGDWTGSHTTKIGIYRGGFWILDTNGNGVYDGGVDPFLAFGGNSGEIPIVGDWNGDGKTKIGYYLRGFWALDYNGNGRFDGLAAGQDRFFALGGTTGEQLLIGAW